MRVAVVVPARGVRAESPKMHGDVFHTETQDFGGDLGQGRNLAGTDILYADAHRKAAIVLEADPSRRRIVEPYQSAIGLDVRGETSPDSGICM